jgi:TonB family protein
VSRSVEKKNTPTAKPSEKLPRSEEKTRQWLAGIKRRFDEEAVRKVKEVQPAPLPSEKDATPAVEPPRGPVNDNTFQQSITLPESPVMPDTGIIARPPDLPTNVAVDTRQPKAEIISQETSSAKAMTFAADSEKKPQRPPSTIDPWPTSSPRKRCPKCNAIYNSELVAYCAVDMTPLVPADQPVVISPPVTATMPLVWILVVSAFIASAGITYLITGYLSKVEKVSAPTTAPPPQAAAVKSDMPVVSGELAGKALTLPEPDYPPTAKTEGVRGTILVRITVDKNGRVISARSSAGDPRLRAAAVKAATKATFSAEKLSGREASGTIVYMFKP